MEIEENRIANIPHVCGGEQARPGTRAGRREKKMKKIEALVNGRWEDDAVGNPNEFETEEEAVAMIPEMARIFECETTEFRIVDR